MLAALNNGHYYNSDYNCCLYKLQLRQSNLNDLSVLLLDRDTLIGKPLDGVCAISNDVDDDVNESELDELAIVLEWDMDYKLTMG